MLGEETDINDSDKSQSMRYKLIINLFLVIMGSTV